MKILCSYIRLAVVVLLLLFSSIISWEEKRNFFSYFSKGEEQVAFEYGPFFVWTTWEARPANVSWGQCFLGWHLWWSKFISLRCRLLWMLALWLTMKLRAIRHYSNIWTHSLMELFPIKQIQQLGPWFCTCHARNSNKIGCDFCVLSKWARDDRFGSWFVKWNAESDEVNLCGWWLVWMHLGTSGSG